MRRSFFYMGRSFTQRHLNASMSPLATGFIRPNALSTTSAALAASPLLANALAGMVTPASSALPTSLSLDGGISQLLSTLLAQGCPVGAMANFVCLQTMSTCVFACERVLTGLLKRQISH